MTYEYPNAWTPTVRRSRVAKFVWGFAAAVAGLVGMGLIAGGTFARPEVERVHLASIEPYYINNFHIMYLAASALLPAAAFFAWKASHRGNLGFWRSTVRPAAMCAGAGLIGLGLSFSSFIATGALQGLGIIAAGVGAAALLFFWILRGPPVELTAADAYWNRALALIFAGATLVGGAGTVKSFTEWSKDRYQIERSGSPFDVQKISRDRWDRDSEDFRVETKTYHLPRLQFNPQPICATLFALMAFGSLSEARYRAGQSRKARATFGRPF
ncbi:MAG TPA: hypothetical protein VMV81_00655 [Phycisphaerae bacterium]|nr:hypothetical protein [Phycisphaerae bacterium]